MIPLLLATNTQAQHGLEALAAIKKEFAFEAAPGYCDSINGTEKSGPLYNWGVGVLLSAMNAAARTDPAWKTELRRFVDATAVYWNPAGPTPGFDVLPLPKDTDRYYDDNSWMALALVESADVLQDPSLLERAKQALAFALSGEDNRLGGGIYWREKERRSKNTCSNAPTVAACLAIYQRTKDPAFLKSAQRIYAWTKHHLLDPSDHLYWDSVTLDGKTDKTKWSYNSALMIRSAAELFRITGDPGYAADAEQLAKASEAKWIVEGRFADAGRFAHLLVEAWTYVPNVSRQEKAVQALDWLYKNGKDARGLYSWAFDKPPTPDQKKFELIDSAAAARALLLVNQTEGR